MQSEYPTLAAACVNHACNNQSKRASATVSRPCCPKLNVSCLSDRMPSRPLRQQAPLRQRYHPCTWMTPRHAFIDYKFLTVPEQDPLLGRCRHEPTSYSHSATLSKHGSDANTQFTPSISRRFQSPMQRFHVHGQARLREHLPTSQHACTAVGRARRAVQMLPVDA